MSVLVLSRADVEALLDLDALVEVLASAMAELSAGRASVPQRVAAMVEQLRFIEAVVPAVFGKQLNSDSNAA